MAPRTLFIIRGLPSAGKTTLAKQLAPDFNTSLHEYCAAFYNGDADSRTDYNVAVTLLGNTVRSWMREGVTPIAIDGVFAAKHTITPWILLAVEYGYRWSVVHVETDLTDADLAGRSMTKCPTNAITLFRSRWQPWGA